MTQVLKFWCSLRFLGFFGFPKPKILKLHFPDVSFILSSWFYFNTFGKKSIVVTEVINLKIVPSRNEDFTRRSGTMKWWKLSWCGPTIFADEEISVAVFISVRFVISLFFVAWQLDSSSILYLECTPLHSTRHLEADELLLWLFLTWLHLNCFNQWNIGHRRYSCISKIFFFFFHMKVAQPDGVKPWATGKRVYFWDKLSKHLRLKI